MRDSSTRRRAPKMRKRPAPVVVEPIFARVIRGPHKDGSARWYWQARVFPEGEVQRTVWSGWAHRDDVVDLLRTLDATPPAAPATSSTATAAPVVEALYT